MDWRTILATAAVLTAGTLVEAQDAAHLQDEQAIRQAAGDYLAAVARGDAKALAEFWTADGDMVDETGRAVSARQLIAQATQAESAAARPVVTLKDTKIRFVTADVAIEDGTSEVAAPGAKGAAVAGRFMAVWVKQDGKWRLASLREERAEAPTPAARLEELDGLVGKWSAMSGDTVFEVSAHWNEARTYLVREMTSLRDGKTIFSGSQRIGWDPLSGTIKSWVFDSSGGRGEGTWTQSGDDWIVHATHILPDGEQTTSSSTYTPEGENKLIWKSTVTLPGGRTLPETVIELERKAASP